ncbi:hypothetical protein [Actinospica sp.]|uniref:hypothetical protein n=1 Tax=Actinospica sp. TaxID=1872142 RepID=UPI002C588798|nr:hypothetical protein [Actinospica sp.]HWG26902.1 hypothetical protein [Actinospica sp.]
MPVFNPRSRRPKLDSDPAFDDAELRRAHDDAAMGGWESVRDLLSRTGNEWPLRTHRITVLANSAVGLEWPRTWIQAEPDRADARVMMAYAEAVQLRSLIARRDPAADDQAAVSAVARCRSAAEAAPDDPAPWISLLTLAGVLGDNGVSMVQWHELSFEAGKRSWGWFQEAVRRHPESWYAHHRMRDAQAARLRTGSPRDLTGLLDFATAAAAHAGDHSPLRVLPLYAHTELRLANTMDLLGDAERDWLTQRNEQDLQDAYREWFRGSERGHPAMPYDLNMLAYQLVETGRPSLAHPVFTAIGPYATSAPWAHAAQLSGARNGNDAFAAARAAAETAAAKAPRNVTEPDPFPETTAPPAPPVPPVAADDPDAPHTFPLTTLTSPE